MSILSSSSFRNRWKTGSTLCDGSPSSSQMFASRESADEGGSRSGFHFALNLSKIYLGSRGNEILFSFFYRSDKNCLSFFGIFFSTLTLRLSVAFFIFIEIFICENFLSGGGSSKSRSKWIEKIDLLDRFHPTADHLPCNSWFNRSEGWQGNDACAPHCF